MSSLHDEGAWNGEIPSTLHGEVADITMQAGELSNDLAALKAWLLCFATHTVSELDSTLSSAVRATASLTTD